jgi:hypothetical protein
MLQSPPACSIRIGLRHLVWAGFWGILLLGTVRVCYTLVGPNLHTVLPGQVYRCAQPSGPQLEWLIQRLHIRTVVNLRGCSDPVPWYTEEARVSNRFGISQEDLSLSAGRLPSVQNVRHLVEILDHSEPPLLFHCHRGADRTGLASMMTILLKTDASLKEARYQLYPWYGHLRLGRTARIDQFFDLYEAWLQEKGIAHSSDTFRLWATREYCPGPFRATIEILAPAGQPLQVQLFHPGVVPVRCTNTSIRAWNFEPGPDAGIHLIWRLLNQDGVVVAQGRSGLFQAVVQPGESIDLTVSLPSLVFPGTYRLRLDLIDELHGTFLQMGNFPVEREVIVR